MEEHSDVIKKVNDEFKSTDFKEWAQTAEKSLKGKPLDKISSVNYEEIKVAPIFSKNDICDLNKIKEELPGTPSYLRGTNIGGYKSKPWFVSQQIPAKNADEFNQIAKFNLEKGQSAITINLKNTKNFNPTNNDSFNRAFERINLKKCPLNIFAGTKSHEQLELIENYLNELQLNWSDIGGGIDSDVISELVASGKLEFSIEDYFDKLVLYFSKLQDSDFKIISVCGTPYREGGGNVLHEIAFTLATAVHYIRILQSKGLKIDDIVQKFRFVLTIGNDFFVEIAKIRSIRVLWSKIVSEFGGNEESQKLDLYIKSLESNKSSLDIWVNLLRNTTETLTSIIGGCDTIELIDYDEFVRVKNEEQNITDDKLNKSIEFSTRITRNIQIVLAEECNLKEVIDPAGGSYYIEYLTDEIAKRSWELFKEVEKQGGIVEALKSGFPQNEVKKTRELRIKNLSTRKDVVLGVNKFPNIHDEMKFDINKNQDFEINLSKTTQLKIEPIARFRTSEKFEELRIKSERFRKNTGNYPQVFVVGFGPLSKHKTRVDFTNDFFHVGGFETVYKRPYTEFEEAAKEFLESLLNIVVFCSSDDLYPEFVPQLARLIKRAKPLIKIIIAGYPTENLEEYKSAGVDEFIHLNADIVKILNELYDYMQV